jgi:hypothetical protein
MRAPVTSIVLLMLVATGCSPDHSVVPAEPSTAVLAQREDAADRTKTKEIHGTIEAVETGTPTPGNPIVVRHLVGGGTASHLGKFTIVADLTLNLATASGAGTGLYTAANGDALMVTAVGQAVIAGGVATVTETVTIIGGTGRFVGATGTLTVVRRVVQATGRSSGTIDGTITLAK